LDGGTAWKSLGNFAISGSQLRVTVANSAADGQVCANAVRIRPSNQPQPIVNNGGPGSWSNSAWSAIPQGIFGDSLVSSSANGSKASQAAWWAPVQPGIYDVALTWPAAGNLSRTVAFDIYDGSRWIQQVVVNQQAAPNDFTDQEVGWKRLGSFTLTSNALHVSTWNSPTDGAVCIDAMRVVPASGLMAAASAPTTAATTSLGDAQLQSMVAAAEAKWAAAGLANAMLDQLKQTRIVLADLPTGYLGITAGNRILISRNAAGFGWFIDSTPTIDEEYARLEAGSGLKAIDPRAVDRIDLLTVVEHELGHVLGLDDLEASLDALMSAQLGTGIRRLPTVLAP
jgi:hypothetical protein